MESSYSFDWFQTVGWCLWDYLIEIAGQSLIKNRADLIILNDLTHIQSAPGYLCWEWSSSNCSSQRGNCKSPPWKNSSIRFIERKAMANILIAVTGSMPPIEQLTWSVLWKNKAMIICLNDWGGKRVYRPLTLPGTLTESSSPWCHATLPQSSQSYPD